MMLSVVIPGQCEALNLEPMNTDGSQRGTAGADLSKSVFMGSRFAPAARPGMTK